MTKFSKVALLTLTMTLTSVLAFGLDSSIYLAAGISVGVSAAGAGIGIGIVLHGFLTAFARNPSVGGKLTVYMFLGFALAETAVIYGFVMAAILLFGGL